MSDIGEGVGGVVEGALTSRAVEPVTGTSASGDPAQTGREGIECLNCGAIASANFCPNCGQKTHIHRSLAAIGHDLMHGVLHLDGKLWRTLPQLTFKPGKLTRRYIEGQRASFVSPMAMFLFSVFAMFAVFQMVGLTTPTDLGGDARTQITGLAQQQRAEIEDEIAQIDEELAGGNASAERRAELERLRDDLTIDLTLLSNRESNLSDWLGSEGAQTVDALRTKGERDVKAAKERLATMEQGTQEYTDLAAEIRTAEEGLRSLNAIEGGKFDFTDESGKTGVAFIDKLVDKWTDNPSLMLYKLQANGYKFSWLLIPLSIPFVWLLFLWRRRFKAYDHAIFVTYSLSFMSLLFIALSLMSAAGLTVDWVVLLFAIIAPLHVYKHLKYSYDLSRFSTLWRFILLSVFMVVVVILFVQALLLLGAF